LKYELLDKSTNPDTRVAAERRNVNDGDERTGIIYKLPVLFM